MPARTGREYLRGLPQQHRAVPYHRYDQKPLTDRVLTFLQQDH
jgi:hypothetical protein